MSKHRAHIQTQLHCVNFYPLPRPNQPKPPSKENITQWLRTLTAEQRQCALSVTSTNFVKMFLKMVSIDQEKGSSSSYMSHNYGLECSDPTNDWANCFYERVQHTHFGVDSKKQKSIKILLDNLYIIDCEAALDTICFRAEFDIEQFLEVMDWLTDNKFLTDSSFNPKDPKYACEWLAYGIEQSVLLRYTNGQKIRQVDLPSIIKIEKFFNDPSFSVAGFEENIRSILDMCRSTILYADFFKDELNTHFDEFVNALLEILTDRDLLPKHHYTTIYNYRDLKQFTLKKIIEKYCMNNTPKQAPQAIKPVQELTKYFTSKLESRILPQKDFRMFSSQPQQQFQKQDDCADIEEMFFSERDSCSQLVLMTSNSESVCELTHLTKQTVTKCFDEVLKQQEEEQKEQQKLQKDRKKRDKKAKKSKLKHIDNSDTVSQVTSIDDHSSLQLRINTWAQEPEAITAPEEPKEQQVPSPPPEIEPPQPQPEIIDDEFQVVEPKKKGKKKKQVKAPRYDFRSDSPAQEFQPKKIQESQRNKQSQQSQEIKQESLKMKKTVSESDCYLTDDQRPKPELIHQTSTPLEKQTVHRLKKKKDANSSVYNSNNNKIVRQVIKDYTQQYKQEDQQHLDQLISNRMQRELEVYIQSLRTSLNKYQRARDIVIQRIQAIVQDEFQGADVQVFGSCRTGLALPDSDIDLAIWGFQYFQRNDLFIPMQTLASQLSYYKWVSKCKHIPSAAIPILKLEIDPSVGFDETSQPDLVSQFPPKVKQNLTLDSKLPSRTFQVDITFETQITYNIHCGIYSTDMINQWLIDNPGFQDVSLILKALLKRKGLNDYFKGGVSSFCLGIMLKAVYLQEFRNPVQSPYLMLETFLYKYGFDFDPTREGVLLPDPRQAHLVSGFVILDSIVVHPITVYSPITGQVVSAGTVNAREILAEFKKLYLDLQDHKKKLNALVMRSVAPEIIRDIVVKKDKTNWKSLPRELTDEKSVFFNYLQ